MSSLITAGLAKAQLLIARGLGLAFKVVTPGCTVSGSVNVVTRRRGGADVTTRFVNQASTRTRVTQRVDALTAISSTSDTRTKIASTILECRK